MGRRVVYLLALSGSLAYYWACRNWLSAVLLITAAGLPWLSLLLSLPAILTVKAKLTCPGAVTKGVSARAQLKCASPFPQPPVSCKLRCRNLNTGETVKLKSGGTISAEHCGAYRIRCRRLWMWDYLGIIRLPVPLREDRLFLVRPEGVQPMALPDLNRHLSAVIRPKPGGGYAENHELRLYRPGDSLRQIHWKLSAKTGDLIVREPMETRQDSALVTMELSGAPALLDRKLGRLLGVSRHLIEKGIRHRICCYTGKGMVILNVSTEAEVTQAIDRILQQPKAPEDETPAYPGAAWRHHIGGDSHEA